MPSANAMTVSATPTLDALEEVYLAEVAEMSIEEAAAFLKQRIPEELNANIKRMRPKERRAAIAQMEAEANNPAGLEAQGWEKWLQALGPQTFTKPFAPFHAEFWNWYWPITQKRLRGERLDIEDLICLYILGRGSGKSANVEWACIAEGALLSKGYVLYICQTESQAKDHLIAIRSRLESAEIARFYPGLANPDIGKHGFRKGWSQDYLATQSGWGIIPAGLEEGIRGGRKDEMRFSLIVCDDIDDFNDSPAVALKKLNAMARSIVPAGTEDTIILFPQNIIHENSVMNQIYTRQSDVFSIRRTIGPYPSFKQIELELTERDDGARVWDIASCESNWEGLDITTARKFLAKSGRTAFLAEYQHDFESGREGRVLRNYNDSLIVIPRSVFATVYSADHIPDRWNKRVFHDWSRTKSAYHANIVGKLTVANQNTKLPGKLWLFDLMSFQEQTQADDVGKRILESICPFVPGTLQTWSELIDASASRAGLEVFVSDLTRLIEARRDVLARVIPKLIQPELTKRHYTSFVGSHDQNNDALEVYRTVFGLAFAPMNPGESGGLEWIDHFMQADKKTPHPFFADELQADGTYKLGCPGMFILVDDEKYPYPKTTTPDALHDSDLARYQFTNWRMRPPKMTEGGLIEHGPMKMHDDFGQGLQMAMVNGPPSPTPLTYAEQIVEATPVKYRVEEMQKGSPNGIGLTPEQEMTAVLNRKFAAQKITPQIIAFDEWGQPAQN